MRKRIMTMNCHPGLVFLGVAVALAIVCFIYRHVIEETLLAVVGLLLVTGLLFGVAVLLRSYRVWSARSALRARAVAQAIVADDPTGIEPTDEHDRTIEESAALLAREDVSVHFAPDGNTIEVTRRGREV